MPIERFVVRMEDVILRMDDRFIDGAGTNVLGRGIVRATNADNAGDW